jgi:7-cyano-7-deazaguanine synthase
MFEPTSNDAAVLVSGGVDSAVLSVDLLGKHARVFPIYVRFGLRWEEIELAALRRFLRDAGSDRTGLMGLTVLDEPVAEVYGDHWSNTGRPGVPDDRTGDEAVYLPGRNVLLAAKAAIWCRLREIDTLAFGILEANPFPDSTPAFFDELQAVLNRAVNGRLEIVRPYAQLPKFEVVRRGARLGLPLHQTFSCLDPVAGLHCDSCNKCAERRASFRAAGVPDRTEYAARSASATETQDVPSHA